MASACVQKVPSKYFKRKPVHMGAEASLWANTIYVMKCLVKCLFEMLVFCLTEERFQSQTFVFCHCEAGSVNPINCAAKTTQG